MPFQSEKQRRYMHANLPKIAKRWERDYAGGGRIGYDEGTISPALKKRMLELLMQGMPLDEIKEEAEKQLKQDPYIRERMNIPGSPVVKEAANGGILDINASEEIISDDGNDIELTAYNAAFDNPNDLSTGVKSLFRAKKGGTSMLVKKRADGKRPGYGWDPGAGAPQATSSPSSSSGGGGPPGGGDPRMTYTAPHVPHHKEEEETKKFAIQEDIRRREEEKGGPEYYGLRDLQNRQTELTTRIQEKITGDWKRYMDPSTWEKVKNIYAFTSVSGAIKEIFKGIKRTSDMRAFMQDLKDIGLAGGPPGTNDPLYDELWLHLEKMDPKYKEETKDEPEGPIYAPLTGAVSEEYAQGVIDPRDWMAEIRAGQAKRAMINPDWQNQENILVANRGGLANLFRVKKQQQEKNMRNDFGTRPYKSRFPYDKGGSSKKQGYDARLDESLGARRGAESTKSQSLKSRRDESKGAEKAAGKRAYSAVGTMDK